MSDAWLKRLQADAGDAPRVEPVVSSRFSRGAELLDAGGEVAGPEPDRVEPVRHGGATYEEVGAALPPLLDGSWQDAASLSLLSVLRAPALVEPFGPEPADWDADPFGPAADDLTVQPLGARPEPAVAPTGDDADPQPAGAPVPAVGGANASPAIPPAPVRAPVAAAKPSTVRADASATAEGVPTDPALPPHRASTDGPRPVLSAARTDDSADRPEPRHQRDPVDATGSGQPAVEAARPRAAADPASADGGSRGPVSARESTLPAVTPPLKLAVAEADVGNPSTIAHAESLGSEATALAPGATPPALVEARPEQNAADVGSAAGRVLASDSARASEAEAGAPRGGGFTVPIGVARPADASAVSAVREPVSDKPALHHDSPFAGATEGAEAGDADAAGKAAPEQSPVSRTQPSASHPSPTSAGTGDGNGVRTDGAQASAPATAAREDHPLATAAAERTVAPASMASRMSSPAAVGASPVGLVPTQPSGSAADPSTAGTTPGALRPLPTSEVARAHAAVVPGEEAAREVSGRSVGPSRIPEVGAEREAGSEAREHNAVHGGPQPPFTSAPVAQPAPVSSAANGPRIPDTPAIADVRGRAAAADLAANALGGPPPGPAEQAPVAPATIALPLAAPPPVALPLAAPPTTGVPLVALPLVDPPPVAPPNATLPLVAPPQVEPVIPPAEPPHPPPMLASASEAGSGVSAPLAMARAASVRSGAGDPAVSAAPDAHEATSTAGPAGHPLAASSTAASPLQASSAAAQGTGPIQRLVATASDGGALGVAPGAVGTTPAPTAGVAPSPPLATPALEVAPGATATTESTASSVSVTPASAAVPPAPFTESRAPDVEARTNQPASNDVIAGRATEYASPLADSVDAVRAASHAPPLDDPMDTAGTPAASSFIAPALVGGETPFAESIVTPALDSPPISSAAPASSEASAGSGAAVDLESASRRDDAPGPREAQRHAGDSGNSRTQESAIVLPTPESIVVPVASTVAPTIASAGKAAHQGASSGARDAVDPVSATPDAVWSQPPAQAQGYAEPQPSAPQPKPAQPTAGSSQGSTGAAEFAPEPTGGPASSTIHASVAPAPTRDAVPQPTSHEGVESVLPQTSAQPRRSALPVPAVTQPHSSAKPIQASALPTSAPAQAQAAAAPAPRSAQPTAGSSQESVGAAGLAPGRAEHHTPSATTTLVAAPSRDSFALAASRGGLDSVLPLHDGKAPEQPVAASATTDSSAAHASGAPARNAVPATDAGASRGSARVIGQASAGAAQSMVAGQQPHAATELIAVADRPRVQGAVADAPLAVAPTDYPSSVVHSSAPESPGQGPSAVTSAQLADRQAPDPAGGASRPATQPPAAASNRAPSVDPGARVGETVRRPEVQPRVADGRLTATDGRGETDEAARRADSSVDRNGAARVDGSRAAGHPPSIAISRPSAPAMDAAAPRVEAAQRAVETRPGDRPRADRLETTRAAALVVPRPVEPAVAGQGSDGPEDARPAPRATTVVGRGTADVAAERGVVPAPVPVPERAAARMAEGLPAIEIEIAGVRVVGRAPPPPAAPRERPRPRTSLDDYVQRWGRPGK